MSVVSYLQVGLAAVAWGTWSLFLRPAGVDPRWSSALMLTVVALATAPLLARKAARGPLEGPPRAPREWWAIVAMGLFDAANAGLFFAAMAKTTVAVAVLSHYLAPLLLAVVAPRVLRTRPQPAAIPLALVALFGLALVLDPLRGLSPSAAVGAACGAGSAVFYAANVLITKRLGGRFSSEEQLVYHAVISAALLALIAVVTRAPSPPLAGLVRIGVASVLIGAGAGLAFLYGLRHVPAEHAGMLTFLEPLTAVVVAVFAFGEQPSRGALVGGLLVVVAGALSVRARRSTSPPMPSI